MAKEDKFEDEMMSDEELDNVAGGGIGQTSEDSQFLYQHGLMDKRYHESEMFFSWSSGSEKVNAGWAKAGITCVTKFSGDNLYFKDGKEISRTEAINDTAARIGIKNSSLYNIQKER